MTGQQELQAFDVAARVGCRRAPCIQAVTGQQKSRYGRIAAEPFGAWWKIRIDSAKPRPTMAVPEMGEPLLRLIVDTHLDGWLDAARPNGADIYLPSHRPR